jgi:hypothetical protein
MKLYRAFNDVIDSANDVLFIWAENEHEVKDEITNIRSKDEYFLDWLFEEVMLNELLDSVKGHECELFGSLMLGLKSSFAKEVFRATDLKRWTIEEIDVPDNHEVYVAYPKEIIEIDDVEIVFVPYETKDINEYILNELAERKSKQGIRDFIDDPAVNMSFNERFYIIDGQYAYSEEELFKPNEDILKKFNYDEKAAHAYIDEQWKKNVIKFFNDEPEYGEMYMDYIINFRQYEEVPFNDDFYRYCTMKLLKMGYWIEYEIKKAK